MWLCKRVVEGVVSLSLTLIVIQQYINPIVLNTIPILQADSINYVLLLERHLKLSLPNLYVWLFHVLLRLPVQYQFHIGGTSLRR